MAVFGKILYLPNVSGAIVFIMVLVVFTLFEGFLHIVEVECNKRGLKGLIKKLYREFMIMGFISFAILIMEELSNFEADVWYDAFHFAHVVLLFVGIVFLIQSGMLTSLVSVRHKQLLKHDNSSGEALIVEYVKVHRDGGLMKIIFDYGPISIPIPELREKIEYKIIQEFFIRNYNLPPEFKFANYMCMVLRDYVIALVEVRPISWVILAVFVTLNYMRILFIDPIYQSDVCGKFHTDKIHKYSSKGGAHRSLFETTSEFVEPLQQNVIRPLFQWWTDSAATGTGTGSGTGDGEAEWIESSSSSGSVGSSSSSGYYGGGNYFSRFLAGTDDHGDDDAHAKDLKYGTHVCHEYMLRYVFVCLIFIMVYLLCVLWASEVYIQRLIDKVLDQEETIEWLEEEQEALQKQQQSLMMMRNSQSGGVAGSAAGGDITSLPSYPTSSSPSSSVAAENSPNKATAASSTGFFQLGSNKKQQSQEKLAGLQPLSKSASNNNMKQQQQAHQVYGESNDDVPMITNPSRSSSMEVAKSPPATTSSSNSSSSSNHHYQPLSPVAAAGEEGGGGGDDLAAAASSRRQSTEYSSATAAIAAAQGASASGRPRRMSQSFRLGSLKGEHGENVDVLAPTPVSVPVPVHGTAALRRLSMHKMESLVNEEMAIMAAAAAAEGTAGAGSAPSGELGNIPSPSKVRTGQQLRRLTSAHRGLSLRNPEDFDAETNMNTARNTMAAASALEGGGGAVGDVEMGRLSTVATAPGAGGIGGGGMIRRMDSRSRMASLGAETDLSQQSGTKLVNNSHNRRFLYLRCLERIMHVEFENHANEARRMSLHDADIAAGGGVGDAAAGGTRKNPVSFYGADGDGGDSEMAAAVAAHRMMSSNEGPSNTTTTTAGTSSGVSRRTHGSMVTQDNMDNRDAFGAVEGGTLASPPGIHRSTSGLSAGGAGGAGAGVPGGDSHLLHSDMRSNFQLMKDLREEMLIERGELDPHHPQQHQHKIHLPKMFGSGGGGASKAQPHEPGRVSTNYSSATEAIAAATLSASEQARMSTQYSSATEAIAAAQRAGVSGDMISATYSMDQELGGTPRVPAVDRANSGWNHSYSTTTGQPPMPSALRSDSAFLAAANNKDNDDVAGAGDVGRRSSDAGAGGAGGAGVRMSTASRSGSLRGRSSSLAYMPEECVQAVREQDQIEINMTPLQRLQVYLHQFGRWAAAQSVIAGRHFVSAMLGHHLGTADEQLHVDFDIAEMQRDFSTIFMFSNAELYYFTVEFGLLIQCVYLAFWATNFVFVAMDSYYPVLWQIALIVPVPINFFIIKQMIFTSVMLKSIVSLNKFVADKICEDAVDERNVKHRVRKVIRTALRTMEIPKEEWHTFTEDQFMLFVPYNDRGLNQTNLRLFLHSMQIFLTDNTVSRIFSVLDFDRDNKILWEDLSPIIFPELMRKQLRLKRKNKSFSERKADGGDEDDDGDSEDEYGMKKKGGKNRRGSASRRGSGRPAGVSFDYHIEGESELKEQKKKLKHKRKQKRESESKSGGTGSAGDSPSTSTTTRPLSTISEHSAASSNSHQNNQNNRSNHRGSPEPGSAEARAAAHQAMGNDRELRALLGIRTQSGNLSPGVDGDNDEEEEEGYHSDSSTGGSSVSTDSTSVE